MRNFSRIGKVITLVLIVTMLSACGGEVATTVPVATNTAPPAAINPTDTATGGAAPTNTTAAGGAGTKSSYVIAMSQANKAEPWREAMNTQIADAAKAHPELQVVFADAAQDNAKQVTDVENFIQQKVDLLIISPNEAAPLTSVVKKAFDSGIPVIVLDRAVNGDAYTMFIGADNVKIGEMAGKFVADWCKANGHAPCNTLEIKGLSGSPPAADRDSGFKTGIAANADVKIVADPTADWLREKAVPAAAAAFQANEQIDVVYGHNDPMAEGAYIAAKNANKDISKMLFVGIDGLPTPDGGIVSVLQGRLGATFVYPTGGMQAIDWAVQILEKGAKPPKKVVLETEQIDGKTAPDLCKKYNCPGAGTGTTASGGTGAKSSYVIAMSQANKAEPWREAMNTQIADAAKAHPELQVVFADAAQDNAKQVTDVENFIQQKVDLLIISPNEAAPLTAVVKKAYDAGMPVIVLDRAVNGDAYTMFIGADNVKIGEMAGKFVADWCKQNGHSPCNTLEIKGLSGSPPAADRDSGFKTGIASNADVKIVADPTADWLREKAVPAAAAAFQANEQIDVVYGHNDPMAEGAYIAAKNANKDISKMLFVGIDGLPTPDGGIVSVLQGRLGATFVYPTGGMQAIDWAVKILEKGEKPPKKVVLETEQIDGKTAPDLCKKYNCPGK